MKKIWRKSLKQPILLWLSCRILGLEQQEKYWKWKDPEVMLFLEFIMLLAVASSVLPAKKQYDLAYRRLALLLMAKSQSEAQPQSDQELTFTHFHGRQAFVSQDRQSPSSWAVAAGAFTIHWSRMLVFPTITWTTYSKTFLQWLDAYIHIYIYICVCICIYWWTHRCKDLSGIISGIWVDVSWNYRLCITSITPI